jgi:SAM-dependent methyltransferase
MSVDFGRTADDYARHRAGFPTELFVRLGDLGVGMPGQQVVDVGTGTGTVARGFAGRGCHVIGIDPSTELLDQARQLDRAAGISVDYRVGTAEATALPDASVDVFSAGQCWHWFDRQAAANEARRVLRPGGAIVICHFDWLPLPGNVVAATEALILEHNPNWRGAGGFGMYPLWTRDVHGAGFSAIETFSFDVDVKYSHEAWRGRIRASAGVAASLSPDEVARFDEQHTTMLNEQFPTGPQSVPHRVWALIAQAPPLTATTPLQHANGEQSRHH